MISESQHQDLKTIPNNSLEPRRDLIRLIRLIRSIESNQTKSGEYVKYIGFRNSFRLKIMKTRTNLDHKQRCLVKRAERAI